MRGAERPADVRWSRPFLGPLKPLAQEAARQTFIDIADDIHETEDIDKVLLLVDNMPLAISLIANLVDSEGITSVLSRWETQRTSILSEGHDARSNLELSISLSLSGPRIRSAPHAHHLLSLLSMLPEGLSDVELLQSKLPIENILACKSILLRTALAYTDGQKRLKTLVPIREYVQRNQPPTTSLIQPLGNHYQELLEIYSRYAGPISSAGLVARLAANFTNIQNVMLQCLSSNSHDLPGIIRSICELTIYGKRMGHGYLPLMDQIVNHLPKATDHRLEAYYSIHILSAWRYRPIPNAKQLIDQVQEHFNHFQDLDMKCELGFIQVSFMS
jgi:hypothetical protein